VNKRVQTPKEEVANVNLSTREKLRGRESSRGKKITSYQREGRRLGKKGAAGGKPRKCAP